MRFVVNLIGDAAHGQLAASGFEERPFLPGGEQNMYELAFAAAALGHEVELRGFIEPRAFERMRAGSGAQPTVELAARRPTGDDLVVVPEGWQDPLEYARLLLSPARLAMFLLAAPGLFGWPFTDGDWRRPDPLTVDVTAVARPRDFQAIDATGFRLLTHSPGLAAAAQDADVSCALIGIGRPSMPAAPAARPRPVDVVALGANRWRPLAERVIAELDGLTVELIEESPNDEILRRFSQAKILLWPSRIEGHATIPWEARSTGCVPVALSSNRFAIGLDESSGAIAVDDLAELAPTIRGLIDDPHRLAQLSARAKTRSREEVDWTRYLERVAEFLSGVTVDDPSAAARGSMGARLAEVDARSDARLIELGAELGAELGRVTSDRDEKADRAAALATHLDDVVADRQAIVWEREYFREQVTTLRGQLTSLQERRAVRAMFRLDGLRADLRGRVESRQGRAEQQPEPWEAYLTSVEPALAAEIRVHRFAQAPIIGDPKTPAMPLAAWIDGDDPAAGRTIAALEDSTVAPAEILRGTFIEALRASRYQRVVLIRAGDVLAPLALERLGQAATLAADAWVITCDEDVLGPDDERIRPHFRPGPSPDRWLACDDSGDLLTVSRDAALNAAALVDGLSDWRHALALELAGAQSAHHAHVPLLLVHRDANRDPTPRNAAATVQAALSRWEPDATVHEVGTGRRIVRPLRGNPNVQVIVCFRDHPELTERCIESVLEQTRHQPIGLTLVDNGSTRPATATLLARLAADPRVTVHRDDRPFNFAVLNNDAVGDAELLVFLNNDTIVTDPDWIDALAQEAQRPQIGAVGPMLRYADGNVQQAGAALGLHGYAGHPFAGLAPEELTPFGRAAEGTRNWLAVTAACMMVERTKFEEVGGFDDRFVVAGNDVDLCLRLTAAGYRSLCVPWATVVHDESRSRGAHIDPGDFAASERSYGLFRTVGDPFYNPSLSLALTDCSVRTPGETF
jgi:GT2 family glycosyltransferase